jgi:hypothetical protein
MKLPETPKFVQKDFWRVLWTPRRRRPLVASLIMWLCFAIVATIAVKHNRELGINVVWLTLVAVLLLLGPLLLLMGGSRRQRLRLLERLRKQQEELQHARQSLEAAKAVVDMELRESAERLAAREQKLNNRLTTFHEWMEFPQPVSLQVSGAEQSPAELASKDRQLLAMLDTETESFFRKIRENYYVQDGNFQPQLLRDDAVDLIHRIAQLYQPDADKPLLETSMSQILRSASRICLQLLIVMDRLPMNAKNFSLNNLYRYARRAVNAYNIYKSAEPYWPYVNTAYYLGRFALGANPIAMGAWWYLGQHGKKLAQELTTRVVNRQVLLLLQDVVRVIGFEAASVYGGDFRHRDVNWVYGVELVELMQQVPMSPKSFQTALQEIGALQLRNEYDRIYLYRCLAAGQSAEPARYRPTEKLVAEERRAVAARLEKFLSMFRLRGGEKALADWASQVEHRLDVKLRTAGDPMPPTADQRRNAGRALAGYLLEVKQVEPQQLTALLSESKALAGLEANERQQFLEALSNEPPFFFEQPLLDPDGPVADAFLADLVELAVRIPPHIADLDVVLSNAAAYLQRDPDEIRKQVDDACRTLLLDRCRSQRSLPSRRLPTDVVRAVLDLVGAEEKVAFVYGRVRLENADGRNLSGPEFEDCWLVGIDGRMLLFSMQEGHPHLLWRATDGVLAERVDSWIGGFCRLHGGEWLEEDVERPRIIVGGAPLRRFEEYFQPLLSFEAVRSVSSTR